MFIYDKPIESEGEDFLDRKRFSHHLGKALLDWKENESLVIAIYGEWGSGKSSIINLANEHIKELKNDDKPTIIEFNPWGFSEEKNLSIHFFNEIAKELEIKHATDKDKKIAEKLKLYAKLLSLTPKKETLTMLSSKILLGLGLIGISSSQILQWLQIPISWIQYVIFGTGVLLFLIGLFKEFLLGLSDFFEQKYLVNKKTIAEIKNEIKDELLKRNKKILIVIDDIDRLNQSEIRQIFRLIRVNADFPHTVYLLAFDRKIVEHNLEEQVGVSGKDYLDKIVQVNFDVPYVRDEKIHSFLSQELGKIIDQLPKSAIKFFESDEKVYWTNIFYSGFKDFFRNVRDVKRYISSLEFNISQMYKKTTMEVNPIDFFAIEAIRVFASDFYKFMRSRKDLFTSTEKDRSRTMDNNPQKKEIDDELNKLPASTKEPVLELIKRLFPQVDGIYQYGYSTHGYEWQSTWSSNLRVCATNNFDSYFTLIPGGDVSELSQFEIESILNKSNSEKTLEKILRGHVKNGKIRKVLQRIQDYTKDYKHIPQSNEKNIIKALFNISDELPDNKKGMFDIGADMEVMRVIYQLLARQKNKQTNFELLKEVIPTSKGLFGPIQKVSLESSRKKENKDPQDFVVPEENLDELQDICVKKIEDTNTDKLLNNNNLLYILFRWKEWDKKDNWKIFIQEIKSEDEKLLQFVDKFVSETRSNTFGDYGIKITKVFVYKNLAEFIELDEVKTKLEMIKKENKKPYKKHKKTIDLFLNNYENREKEDQN